METGVATRRWTTSTPTSATSTDRSSSPRFSCARLFEASKMAARRIVFAEGEDERVLRAANAICWRKRTTSRS